MKIDFNFIILPFLSACLEMAFQEYQEKNMIFDWWRKLLINFSQGKSTYRKKISLVLGLCPYCNGFWVSVFIYIYTYSFNPVGILLFCGLNYFFIVLILKLIK